MTRFCGLTCLPFVWVASVSGADPSPLSSQPSSSVTAQVSVCFSPPGRCTQVIVNAVNQAQKSIHIEAHSFTSNRIGNALLEAMNRGVEVTLVLDTGYEQNRSMVADLRDRRVRVFVDDQHIGFNSQAILIDQRWVLTGSCSFSDSWDPSERDNVENLVIIDSETLCSQYETDFRRHLVHGLPYEAVSKTTVETRTWAPRSPLYDIPRRFTPARPPRFCAPRVGDPTPYTSSIWAEPVR